MALGGGDEIVAAAKAFARTIHDNDVNLLAGLRLLDRRSELAWHMAADGVQALRSVEEQACDPRLLRVLLNSEKA